MLAGRSDIGGIPELGNVARCHGIPTKDIPNKGGKRVKYQGSELEVIQSLVGSPIAASLAIGDVLSPQRLRWNVGKRPKVA